MTDLDGWERMRSERDHYREKHLEQVALTEAAHARGQQDALAEAGGVTKP